MNNDKSCYYEVSRPSSKIFKKWEILNFNYRPQTVKFREEQLNTMMKYSKAVGSGYATANILLKGGYSTGKISTMQTYFHKLKKEHNKVKCVYIQCNNHNSKYKIYTEIHKVLTGIPVINGVHTTQLHNKIIKQIVKKELVLVVGLSEYNSMKNQNEMNNLCNSLLRVTETDKKAQISIIASTSRNDRNDYLLDEELQMIFQHLVIDFPPYTPDEIHEILKNRAEKAFHEGVISDEIIQIITKSTYSKRNLKHGLQLLLEAGHNAEQEQSSTIEKKHLITTNTLEGGGGVLKIENNKSSIKKPLKID
jgi:cell division control protein 6